MKCSDTRINFYGSPTTWDITGRLKGIVYRNDIRSIGFAIAASEICLNGGLITVGHTPSVRDAVGLAIFIGVQNLATLAFSRSLEQMWMRRVFSKETIKSKCIETQPDDSLPPSLHQYGQQARRLGKNYKIGSIIISSLCIASAGIYALGAAPLLVRQLEGWKRWRKVERGEWVVVDKGPPPEPVRKTQSIFSQRVATAAATL
ncbi:MAG: hypothetical protein AB7H77_02535 [Bdellovibrionales bacterium]